MVAILQTKFSIQFLVENGGIVIQILLNCELMNNTSPSVHTMSWHRAGDKPSPEPANVDLIHECIHMRHLASMS